MIRSIYNLTSRTSYRTCFMHRFKIGILLLHPCQKLVVLKLLSQTYVGMVNPQINGFKLISNLAFKRTEISELLIKHLGCSFEEASDIFELNSDFLLQNETRIGDYTTIMNKSGILSRTIKDNFWIFSYEKVELLNRLVLFNKCKFTDPNNGICILRLPFKTLTKVALHLEDDALACGGKNRIAYFASQVQCDEKRACEVFVRYMFMMTLKLESIKKILAMVKAQGVLTEDLLNDLWFFRYSQKFLTKRIKLLDHIGARQKCRSLKPWMLRCNEIILKRYFELKEENMAALGSYSNINDLLSNELDLSSAEVDEMILKHPPLAKISYSKAKEMIEFLKAEGFDSKMICHVPRVLCHKQATLTARMEEISKINPQLMNLTNLCRNKKDFISLLNKMSFT